MNTGRAKMSRRAATALAIIAVSLSALCGCGGVNGRGSTRTAGPGTAVGSRVVSAYGRLELSFERNAGQTDPRVQFVGRGPGSAVFFTRREAVLALTDRPGAREQVLRLQFAGARRVAPRGAERLPGSVNYFIGSDRSRWRTRVPTYAQVRYLQLWPGIDASFYGHNARLEFDLHLAPGADPDRIALRFAGTRMQRIESRGALVLTLAGGARVRELAPTAYQVVAGKRRLIKSRYALEGGVARIVLGGYDRRLPLTVDPVLVYSTYLGGNGNDVGTAIAVDAAGEAYLTGYTTSANFPTQSPEQGSYAGSSDAFVTKLDATGSAIVYSTYLGGSGNDTGHGIAIDSGGNAYITGYTQSTNFPTQNPEQSMNHLGYGDAFITKLNASGSALVYSTYLGGTGDDAGYGIAVDGAGEAYVTGVTYSTTDFPTHNAEQPTFGGGPDDAFVTKLNAGGSGLLYSTYLGGGSYDTGNAIAVDAAGDAFVTGFTYSTNFPTRNPEQAARGGGIGADAFVTELRADGSGFIYSTYLGGSGNDAGNGIAVDSGGSAYVAGQTTGSFPLQSPEQPMIAGGYEDAFVTKFKADGSALLYSTYLGGSGDDAASGIAVDQAGDAYVIGSTNSTDFPTQSAPQPTGGGGYDAFVTKLNPTGGALVYSSYLGGASDETGLGIALDTLGAAYVTGYTTSTNFPIANALQSAGGGGQDAFLTKFAAPDATPPTSTAAVPTCHGPVTVTVVDDPYGAGPKAVHFRIDGGAEQVTATAGNPGTAAITVPEGNHTLEYWGEDGAGNQESPHHAVPVQVDTTPPALSIASDQGFSSYEIGDKATVTVTASDATSGLAVDPSRSDVPISTAHPGHLTLGITATDHCANSTTASFAYTVITNPTLARTVNLESVTGTVLVELPGAAGSASARAAGGGGLAVLAGARQVPVGTTVDATAGKVKVTTATVERGRTQAGSFDGGRFKVVQSRAGRGLAELRLIDGNAPHACTTRVLGVLDARTKGRFLTRGRYASATIGGTASSWSTTDRCGSTLIRVTRGGVTVRDFRRHQSVTIRAGQAYLARR